MQTRAAFAASALLVAGCASEAQQQNPGLWTDPGSKVQQSSGLLVEQWFPMKDGDVYQYETSNEVNERGRLMIRVKRDDSGRGTFRYPAGNKIFEFRPDGLYNVSKDRFVLKMPAEVGNSWPGENGGTTKIVSTTAIVQVPAGRYEGCLQTLEEKGGTRYGTTFCPNVGIVLLEAASGHTFERASLASVGPVVNIGPDGLTKSQSDNPPQGPSPAPSPGSVPRPVGPLAVESAAGPRVREEARARACDAEPERQE